MQAVDRFDPGWPEPYRLIQNSGRGLLIQGTREWTDSRVAATVRPEMVRAAGIAARAQGLRRHYALLMAVNDTVRLIKELDGSTVLAEAEVAQVFGRPSELALDVEGIACKRASTGRCCSTSSTAVRRSRVAPWPSSARTAA